jgi:hypothetical protein
MAMVFWLPLPRVMTVFFFALCGKHILLAPLWQSSLQRQERSAGRGAHKNRPFAPEDSWDGGNKKLNHEDQVAEPLDAVVAGGTINCDTESILDRSRNIFTRCSPAQVEMVLGSKHLFDLCLPY